MNLKIKSMLVKLKRINFAKENAFNVSTIFDEISWNKF